MKHRRDAGEILISSESDGGDIDDMDVSDDDGSVDDAHDDDDDDIDVSDDDESVDDAQDDDDEDDDDGDDDDSDYDDDEEEEEEDDRSDDSDDDNARRSHQQRLKKGGGHANSETALTKEPQKLFAEASNIIRGGDLEKLNLEHCKAYLRHYSLRQTGTKKTLLDRVREHVELKACGGMAKYPRSTFTINCTGDACTGDVVLFQQRVKKHNSYKKAQKGSKQPSFLRRIVAGRIVKESYGSEKQQHTFTVEVLWTRGPKALPLLYPLLIKGRNLYRLRTFRQRWANEEERKRVLQEKHSRGHVARKTREDRISGKRHNCSNQGRLSKRKAEVTLKREQTMTNFSRVNTNACVASSSRGKAGGNNTSKETAFREGSSVVSSHRQYGNRFCGTSRSTECVLSINAGFAGLLIGPQGRNIDGISRASGATVQICENPLNPMSRLVKIIGVSEGVEIATRMVIQSFLDRGLPPTVVTTLSNGFTSQGWQAQNSSNGFSVPNHSQYIYAPRQGFR